MPEGISEGGNNHAGGARLQQEPPSSAATPFGQDGPSAPSGCRAGSPRRKRPTKGEPLSEAYAASKETLVQDARLVLETVLDFSRFGSKVTLRDYQKEVALAVIESVLGRQGISLVVMFPRQSGKNELQAQLESYLLCLFSGTDAEIVKVSPTWKPQSQNAMRRLERTLKRNPLTQTLWQKEAGYIYRVGSARVYFLSAAPESNIVGATASTLLEVDEAQDVLPGKFDKEVAPMAASTNATRVFWGTAWTGADPAGARAARREAGGKAGWHPARLPPEWRRRGARGARIRQVRRRAGLPPGAQPPDGLHPVFQRGDHRRERHVPRLAGGADEGWRGGGGNSARARGGQDLRLSAGCGRAG